MMGRLSALRSKWLVRFGIAFTLGFAVASIAISLIPARTTVVGPASIASEASLGSGRTALHIPPFGTITAHTHTAPLDVTLTLRTVDFQPLTELATSESGRERLVEEMEADLKAMTVRGATWLVLGGALLGAVGGALAFARRWNLVAVSAAGGMFAIAVFVTLTGATYDLDAFENLSYSGALVDAPELIETVNRGIGAVEELESRYEAATDRLAEVLVLMAEPDHDPQSGTTAILHVGDIHSNPLGLRIIEDLAREFNVDAVLDTGDITSYGETAERNVIQLVGEIEVPYLYVSGNHDARFIQQDLGRLDNVIVLDREVYDLNGIDIMGWPDPTFTESHEESFDEIVAIKEEESPVVAAAVAELTPNVLAVHDARIAEASVGAVPLILSGHYHEQRVEEENGTLSLTVGSTGAAGIKSFTTEADMRYEAQIVYFRGDSVIATDYISLTGLGGDFELERATYRDDEGTASEEVEDP